MTAAIHPPLSFPGLDQFRPRLVRPTVGPRPAAPPRRRTAAAPTAATYRRRRAIALLALVMISLGGWLVAVPMVSASTVGLLSDTQVSTGAVPLPAGPIATHHYVVQPGDTLWTIARQLQPDGDIRPLVDRLAQRHGGSALQAGERLDLDDLGR